MASHRITMLGTGLIGTFYTMALHHGRSRDRVDHVYSRTPANAAAFAEKFGIARHSSDLAAAINNPETDVVVVGLPNDRHLEAVELIAAAGKSVLCTKPLGRTAAEARRMLEIVEKAGVFNGYLEDLVYPPKTLKALADARAGRLGRVCWVRSRECHPGPHSAWFWDPARSGGGALLDMGCHCVEIGRSFIGKDVRPVEVLCWADTLVHPIPAEDNAIVLVRYANGAIGQVEVSWSFRGGMDIRDEVQGTEGTVWLNHFLRTGYEMFTSGAAGGYVAEKAETQSGWLFPVGVENHEMGVHDMFFDMLDALDAGRPPVETFYDGYVVNAILDACYRSVKSHGWEPVEIADWRGSEQSDPIRAARETEGDYDVVKRERLPDGKVRVILKHRTTAEITERME